MDVNHSNIEKAVLGSKAQWFMIYFLKSVLFSLAQHSDVMIYLYVRSIKHRTLANSSSGINRERKKNCLLS